jgi:hypothetical protein
MEIGLEQNKIEETPTHTPPTSNLLSVEYNNEMNEARSKCHDRN